MHLKKKKPNWQVCNDGKLCILNNPPLFSCSYIFYYCLNKQRKHQNRYINDAKIKFYAKNVISVFFHFSYFVSCILSTTLQLVMKVEILLYYYYYYYYYHYYYLPKLNYDIRNIMQFSVHIFLYNRAPNVLQFKNSPQFINPLLQTISTFSGQ